MPTERALGACCSTRAIGLPSRIKGLAKNPSNMSLWSRFGFVFRMVWSAGLCELAHSLMGILSLKGLLREQGWLSIKLMLMTREEFWADITSSPCEELWQNDISDLCSFLSLTQALATSSLHFWVALGQSKKFWNETSWGQWSSGREWREMGDTETCPGNWVMPRFFTSFCASWL